MGILSTDMGFPRCDIEGMPLYEIDAKQERALNESNSRDVFAEAIKETSSVRLQEMGIQFSVGTVVRFAIVDHSYLWESYKGQMLTAYDRLQRFLEEMLLSISGILVKISNDSLICFFPEKSHCTSTIRAIYMACVLQNELKCNPIKLEKCDVTDHLKIHVVLATGPVYKRKLHIQKKVLADYHGECMDAVLGFSLPLLKESSFFNITKHPNQLCKGLFHLCVFKMEEGEKYVKYRMSPDAAATLGLYRNNKNEKKEKKLLIVDSGNLQMQAQ